MPITPPSLVRFVLLLFAVGCPVVAEESLPLLQVETIASPVIAARNWTQGLAPTADGGWDFITQYYNYKYGHNDADHPPQWLVVDLAKGTQKSVELPGYANTNYTLKNQMRAANGRIFFSAYGNRIHFYDPAERTVKTIGQLIPPKEESGYATFFRLSFGPDGKFYASTQSSNRRAAVAQIDPDTLAYQVWKDLGSPDRQEDLTYAYYHAVDPPWVYIGVGKGDWYLVALNTETGEQRILAGPAQWISFNHSDFGIRVNLKLPADLSVDLGDKPSVWIGNVNHLAESRTQYNWCRDGVLYEAEGAQENPDIPGKTMAERWPNWQRKNIALPEVTLGDPDLNGDVALQWKPLEADDRRTVTINTSWAEPIHLESLTTLPDGRIMGNARQYHGFFIHDSKSGQTQAFGRHGPSRPIYTFVKDKLYFSGYPNCNTWVFDPSQPWKTGENPKTIGYFGTISGAHYAYFLFPDAQQSRLYCVGRRERGASGTGISYYDFASQTYHGHADGYPYLQPRGAVLTADDQYLILSGQLIDSPYGKEERPAEARLVVLDRDLKNEKRLTVKPGLASTGRLYLTDNTDQIIGHIKDEGIHAAYRYDLKQQTLIAWTDLAQPSSYLFRDGNGGWWTIGDNDHILYRLDPATLALTAVAQLSQTIQLPRFQDRRIIGTSEADLVSVNLP